MSKKESAEMSQACTSRRYEITSADLPLSCPPRDTRVWDAHPRVYLPIEEEGEALCYYCGALYVLTDKINKESSSSSSSSSEVK